MSQLKWQEDYQRKLVSYEEAAKQIRSGDFIGIPLGVGMCSNNLLDAILDRHEELENVIICDCIQVYPSKLYDPAFMAGLDGRINHLAFFGIATIRKMYNTQVSDYYPSGAHDAGANLAERSDIFALMVSAPNKDGYVNLGLTCFYTLDAIKRGRKIGKLRTIIAEVNDQMPVVFGENWIHVSEFDFIIERSAPIPTFTRSPASEIEQRIGEYALELINDGDTIQMGLGGISEAVAAGLKGKRNLGVLSEMMPMALQQLVEQGIVTNTQKPYHQGISVASFILGDQPLYDYVSENPGVQIYPASYINNSRLVAQHPNFVGMNTSLMIDFTGQSTAEGIGHTMVSGIGGQLDFMIGAYWSEGGKGINMLASSRMGADGSLTSTIVPALPPGTPVSVPRTFTNYVISEYGIAKLKNKARRERALELISIAHPDLRGELKNSLKKNFYPNPSIDWACNYGRGSGLT